MTCLSVRRARTIGNPAALYNRHLSFSCFDRQKNRRDSLNSQASLWSTRRRKRAAINQNSERADREHTDGRHGSGIAPWSCECVNQPFTAFYIRRIETALKSPPTNITWLIAACSPPSASATILMLIARHYYYDKIASKHRTWWSNQARNSSTLRVVNKPYKSGRVASPR